MSKSKIKSISTVYAVKQCASLSTEQPQAGPEQLVVNVKFRENSNL